MGTMMQLQLSFHRGSVALPAVAAVREKVANPKADQVEKEKMIRVSSNVCATHTQLYVQMYHCMCVLCG